MAIFTVIVVKSGEDLRKGAAVSKRFRGNYTHTIDGKGRIIVPAKFRELLGDRCLLTIGQEECIAMYTEEDFDTLMDKLEETPTFSDEALRKLKRNIFSNTDDQEFDKQGRIMIAPYLRDAAGIALGEDVCVRGMGSHIEIWNPEKWAKYNEDFEFGRSGAALAPYNL